MKRKKDLLGASRITVGEITNESIKKAITACPKCGVGSFQPPSEKCIFCGEKMKEGNGKSKLVMRRA